MTHISWSSDFSLYIEDYLIHEHHILGLCMATEILKSKSVHHRRHRNMHPTIPNSHEKLMTCHFHPKVYQKLIIFLILCSL